MFYSLPPSSAVFQFPSGNIYSRRLLLHALHMAPDGAHIKPDPDILGSLSGQSGFDTNVIMIMAILMSASISVLGQKNLIRCALRYTTWVTLQSTDHATPQLAITGVKRKLFKNLPSLIYRAGSRTPYLDSQCIICLSEFVEGDRVRSFQGDTWLVFHLTCPTCRQCLLDACPKINGQAVPSQSPLMLPTVIVPLEREGIINNFERMCSGTVS